MGLLPLVLPLDNQGQGWRTTKRSHLVLKPRKSYLMLSQLHRDHFAPHASRTFEGYYTRTETEDRATIVIIFCWVKGAKKRGNLVMVLYDRAHAHDHGQEADPGTRRSLPSFKYTFYPEHFDVSVGDYVPDQPQAFTIVAPGLGSMKVSRTTIEYDISVPERALRLRLVLENHVPWSRSRPLQGPMGPILHFSRLLPLNWHVRSTQSAAACTLMHAQTTIHGTGRAHVEKNWGSSFPRGWIWAQAFSADGKHTLCLAGGTALPGVQAYLVGYRSHACPDWDFRPPFALGLGWFAPFMHARHDRAKGEFELSVSTWCRKLHVRIKAPPESFVGVPAPLKDGHEPDFGQESFRARVAIQAFGRRRPWEQWGLVEDAILGQTVHEDCGALEFGGPSLAKC
ncbi:hypothetical protein BD414DRAFT_43730 [Trametes punicea]|nr:hypothetical protein BD414DRAFT_43730 [Trametes punicea]